MTIFLDGQYIDANDQMVGGLTPGQRRLYGVFETMRGNQGKIALMDAHLKRLSDGTKQLGLKDPWTASRWKTIVRRLLKLNGHAQSRVRLMVWREGKALRHAAMALKYQPPTKRQLRTGIKAMTVKTKHPMSSRRARVKSLDYAAMAQAHQEAAKCGYDEALLINAKGHVVEASRANLFVLSKGVWVTPPLGDGCLDGIMRAWAINRALKCNVPVEERPITRAGIINSDGVFLTNALMGAMPVAAIDGTALKIPAHTPCPFDALPL